LSIVLELFLAKEFLSHGKAALRTKDVSFNTGNLDRLDLLGQFSVRKIPLGAVHGFQTGSVDGQEPLFYLSPARSSSV
jgi:hypothetical protein